MASLPTMSRQAPDTLPTKSDLIEEIEEKRRESRGKNGRFTPPTLKEVTEYMDAQGYELDPERFMAFYESKGWMVGKNKMKDWKAAARGWWSRNKPKKSEEINWS